MQIQKVNNNYNRSNSITFQKILRNNIPAEAIKDNHYLLLVSGPSGVGKNTIMDKLLHRFNQVVTCTTRAKREDEVEGVSYFFLTLEKFLEGVKNNEFIEYIKGFSGNYYGTKKETIQNAMNGEKPALLIVDVDGAKKIKNRLKDSSGINVVSVFIKPPSAKVLEKRLSGRGTENAIAIQERLARSKYEMRQAKFFDAVIRNNDCESSVRDSVRDFEELLHLK